MSKSCEIPGSLEPLLKSLMLRKVREVLPRELERISKTECSYTEFLERILREEVQDRQTRALENRIKAARLPERLTLESFPWKRQTGVKPAFIRQLGELGFVRHGQNIVFSGKTGVGKTGLAIGLLMKAMESGHRALFIKAQDLLDQMYASLADRFTRRLLNRLATVDVLCIDELGYINVKPEQANLFFKLVEERHLKKPTIITTNMEYEEWFDFLGNKKMVEALLSRLRQRCHQVSIDGPCLRDPEL